MGIYGQPNSWQCGPFALKHAFLTYGIFAHEDDLARVAGSSEIVGTDEKQLARAALRHGLMLQVVRKTDMHAARSELQRWLEHGVPVLLCVDQWDHWITAIALEGDDVVVFDSHYDAPLRIEPWEALLPRWGFREQRLRGVWKRTLYDLQPLVRRKPGFRLALTRERARYLLRPENTALTQCWDDVARALLSLAVVPGAQLELAFPLERFIGARRAAIVDRAAQLGSVNRDAAEWWTEAVAFVARLYNALLRPDLESQVIETIAALIAPRAAVPAAGPSVALAAS